jgi:hypothetical protein
MNRSITQRRFPVLASALAGVILGCGGAGMASAGPVATPEQPAASRPAIPNAAVQYWQAFAALPAFDQQQREILNNVSSANLDPQAIHLVDASATSLRQLHRGAAIRECDWGLHKEDGLLMLLPHLAKVRDVARLACLRARLEFQHGNANAAFDDLSDALTVARQSGADATLIAMLVQDSIEQTVVDVAASGLAGADSPALQHFGSSLASLPPGGSLNSAAIAMEHQLGLEWVIGKLKDLKPGESWQDIVPGGDAEDGPTIDDLIKSAHGDTAGVIKRLEATRPYYEKMPAILNLPPDQFRAKAQALYQQYAQDAWGKMILPDYTKIYDKQMSAEVRLAMLQAAVATVQFGPGAAGKFHDPAGTGAFAYETLPNGFELRSRLTVSEKPVTLTVTRSH